MCRVRVKTRVYVNGKRDTIEQRQLCRFAVGDQVCDRVDRENLGEERIYSSEPDTSSSSVRPNPHEYYSFDLSRASLGQQRRPIRNRGRDPILHQRGTRRLGQVNEEIMPEAPSPPLLPHPHRHTRHVRPFMSVEPLPSEEMPQAVERSNFSEPPPSLLGQSLSGHRRTPSEPLSHSGSQRSQSSTHRRRSSTTYPSVTIPGLSQIQPTSMAGSQRGSRHESRHDSGYAGPGAASIVSSSVDSEFSKRADIRDILRRQRQAADQAFIAQDDDERQAHIEWERMTGREALRRANNTSNPQRDTSSDHTSRENSADCEAHRRATYEQLEGTGSYSGTPRRRVTKYYYPDRERTSTTSPTSNKTVRWSGDVPVEEDNEGTARDVERVRKTEKRMEDAAAYMRRSGETATSMTEQKEEPKRRRRHRRHSSKTDESER